MELKESHIRAIIKQVISESFNSIEEAQRGKQLDSYIELVLSSISPFIDPLSVSNIDTSELNLNGVEIMKKVEALLDMKINKILLQTFNHTDFYIINLGDFKLKTNQGEIKLSFNKNGDEIVKYSYPYVYIYHDIIEVLRFGSRFLDTDAIVTKKANDFLKNKNISLNPQTEKGVKKANIKQEPGKIIIINDFDTDNIIDVVDWANVKRPEAPKKDRSPKLKNAYVAGQPFKHNLYGKGIIKKTKKFGLDDARNQIFDILVDFNGKEKKFRVGKK